MSHFRIGGVSSWPVGSIVILSVYLRQRGSPESKLVNMPNDKTGSE